MILKDLFEIYEGILEDLEKQYDDQVHRATLLKKSNPEYLKIEKEFTKFAHDFNSANIDGKKGPMRDAVVRMKRVLDSIEGK